MNVQDRMPLINNVIQQYYTKLNERCFDNPELREFLARTRDIITDKKMHAASHAKPVCEVAWSRR